MERDKSPRAVAQAGVVSLRRIKQRMLAIHVGGPEPQRLLEVEQLAVYRVYFELAEGAILPRWVGTAPRSWHDGGLWLWAELVATLESLRADLPRVNDISDWQLPIIGQQLPLHVSPPERIAAWIRVSVAVVDALIDAVEALVPQTSARASTDPEISQEWLHTAGTTAATDWIRKRVSAIKCPIARATEGFVLLHHCARMDGYDDGVFPSAGHNEKAHAIWLILGPTLDEVAALAEGAGIDSTPLIEAKHTLEKARAERALIVLDRVRARVLSGADDPEGDNHAAGAGDADGEEGRSAAKGGRPKYSPEERQGHFDLLVEWEAAHAEGIKMAAFAIRKSLLLGECRGRIQRAREWRKAARKPTAGESV